MTLSRLLFTINTDQSDYSIYLLSDNVEIPTRDNVLSLIYKPSAPTYKNMVHMNANSE